VQCARLLLDLAIIRHRSRCQHPDAAQRHHEVAARCQKRVLGFALQHALQAHESRLCKAGVRVLRRAQQARNTAVR